MYLSVIIIIYYYIAIISSILSCHSVLLPAASCGSIAHEKAGHVLPVGGALYLGNTSSLARFGLRTLDSIFNPNH